jgi:DNA-binding transcriptional LysR family regulator
LLRLFNAPGVGRPRIYSSSSLSTIVRMALDGIGISVIPPVAIRDELADGRLRIVPTQNRMPDLSYCVAYAASGDNDLQKALADLACTIARQNDAANGKDDARLGKDDAAHGKHAAISIDYENRCENTISQMD